MAAADGGLIDEALALRVVNAAGFVTTLGGAPVEDAVLAAQSALGRVNVEVRALADWAGLQLAAATGAEAGWVTAGAAAGLALAAAACIAGSDPARARALPHGPNRPEIIVQRSLHNAYNHALELGGAHLVEVGYPSRPGLGRTYAWEIEAAIGEQTVAIAHAVMLDDGAIPLEAVVEIARRHGLPVIVDAAAELPPVTNLRAFVEAGADLVVFSGGKAIRGPQASGILAGRADLVASARLQQLDMDVDPVIWREQEGAEPPQHGIGRSMKVGKEEIVGLVIALERFQATDHDEQARELEDWLRAAAGSIKGATIRPGGTARGFYPRLVLPIGRERARAIYRALVASSPSVRVAQPGLEAGEIVICPEAIALTDRDHVVRSLTDALARPV